jgi:hypothetical protein
VVATWHPSAILRAPAPAAERMRAELADDLARAARLADEAAGEADTSRRSPFDGPLPHNSRPSPQPARPS